MKRIYSEDLQNDYISMTDIAKKREGEYLGYVIQNWLRNKSTVTFVGLWKLIHNPNSNCVEFEAIKNETGLNSFVLTPKRWVETTNAIGIVTIYLILYYSVLYSETDKEQLVAYMRKLNVEVNKVYEVISDGNSGNM